MKSEHPGEHKRSVTEWEEFVRLNEEFIQARYIAYIQQQAASAGEDMSNVSTPHKQTIISLPTSPAAKTVYEGNILRYYPDQKLKYISRWAMLTNREFKCYKSQFNAKFHPDEPLTEINLYDIGRVQVLGNFDDSTRQHFEIVLKGTATQKTDRTSNGECMEDRIIFSAELESIGRKWINALKSAINYFD